MNKTIAIQIMKFFKYVFMVAIASLSSCSSNFKASDIKNTKWVTTDKIDFIEFMDSTCLVTNTSKRTQNKDTILAKYEIHKDTIKLIPLQEFVEFRTDFLVTDSGLVNLRRNIVVAHKIAD